MALVLGFLNYIIAIIAMIVVSIATKKEPVFLAGCTVQTLLKVRDNIP